MTYRTLPLDNVHLVMHQLSAWDDTLRQKTQAAATGISCVSMFSRFDEKQETTPGTWEDVPVHAALVLNMVELATALFKSEYSTTLLNLHLRALRQSVVYEIVSSGSGYRRVVPYLVVGSVLAEGAEV